MKRIVLLLVLTLFATPVLAEGQLKLDYDSQRPGGDYSNFIVRDVRECARNCELSDRCQAFDFYNSDKSCWLKDKVYQARGYQGVISGAKILNTPPKRANISNKIKLDFNTQRPGGDYTSFQVHGLQQCADKCVQDNQCVAFDFTRYDSFCYLKSWLPPARGGYTGIDSGVKKKNVIKIQPVSTPVMSVQKLLIRQGYNPGKADGIMGKRTKDSLKNYQRDHSLPVTGIIDETTLITLGAQQVPTSKPAVKVPATVPSLHPEVINVAIFPWILDDEASSFTDYLKETLDYRIDQLDELKLVKSYYKIKKIPTLNVSGSSKFYGWNQPDSSIFINTYNQPNIPIIKQIGKEQDIQLAILGIMSIHCRWSDNCQVRQMEILLIDLTTGEITSEKGSSGDMDARDYIDSMIEKVLKKFNGRR